MSLNPFLISIYLMALFQTSVLKKYLAGQEQAPMHAAFGTYLTYSREQKVKAQALQSDISRLDREIEALVYELYGLTEEEIRVVEVN
jgi:hypothetical protein